MEGRVMQTGFILDAEQVVDAATDSLDLLRRYAGTGCCETFRELVKRHQSLVFASCMEVLHDRADAEDATQETFIRLARNADKVETSVEGWLRCCATTCALMHLRGNMRRRAREERYAREQERLHEDEVFDDWRGYIDRCLECLPAEDRDLIIDYYLRGETMMRLGKRLGVNASTIKRRLDKATAQLRQQARRGGLLTLRGFLIGVLLPLPVLLWWHGMRLRAASSLTGWLARSAIE